MKTLGESREDTVLMVYTSSDSVREFATELAPVLARTFPNFAIVECLLKIFPASWKQILVHLIPNMGDRSKPSNYRPIALTSFILKLFEFILKCHVFSHLERCKLLSDHRDGVHKGRSTGIILMNVKDVRSTTLCDQGRILS